MGNGADANMGNGADIVVRGTAAVCVETGKLLSAGGAAGGPWLSIIRNLINSSPNIRV